MGLLSVGVLVDPLSILAARMALAGQLVAD